MSDETKQHDDGGPAFPHKDGKYYETIQVGSHGISIRDYFAAKIIGALLAPETIVAWSTLHRDGEAMDRVEKLAEHAAADAYRFADAMLKARSA